MTLAKLHFNDQGNLNGGILTNISLAQIQSTLVDNFPNSTTRTRNFQALSTFLKNLDSNIITRIWLDGSFCTQKENPKDIDVLLFFKHSPDIEKYLKDIKEKASTCLDIYQIGDKDHIEKTRPIYSHMAHNETYWMGQFGFDRNRNHKGIIELKTENLK
ncbi:TPA: hypothetical protein VZJ95_000312 [Streptococcus pneumoniae]|uniref:Polymerase nucleotidyl transferase domain-containing protein n=1 Tax=Streptococcus pneumoniae TaxID=1313 RepID=A0A064C350_STREE|nr:hypothetical protein SpnNT_01635 [Streptococcus pneumoniae]EPD19569.1 hypothetical protein SP6UMMC_06372 [Streptococcus pneumoniae MNZ41]EPD20545.1 hypothetical protein SP4UMMC_06618 [Streptococcus pneumoniae MNZ14]ETE03084.1 hypothetical protein U756_01555 [Streptococcus pneumoniae 27]ETE28185.1 hypothetical protein U755_00460 [Streptococcus pneumoniae 1719]KGI36250.1 hypothetical protein X231_0084 [Streptococcus pneumoniae ECC_3510]KNB75611.1 hypothetical protein U754_11760 [Streptococcu